MNCKIHVMFRLGYGVHILSHVRDYEILGSHLHEDQVQRPRRLQANREHAKLIPKGSCLTHTQKVNQGKLMAIK